MKSLGLTLLSVLFLFTTSGCKVGSSRVWYNVYGNECHTGGPRPGCNFYRDGSKVVDEEDPYYDTDYHLDYYYGYGYYDSYNNYHSFYGWGWVSPNGILYNEYGRALNEDNGEEGFDIISDAAEEETNLVTNVGKSFAKANSLSEATGIRIAKTLNDWAKIEKSRSRTLSDVDDFTKRLLGVKSKDLSKALAEAEKGDFTELNDVNDRIAKSWGTKPSVSKKVLKNWYQDELDAVGYK